MIVALWVKRKGGWGLHFDKGLVDPVVLVWLLSGRGSREVPQHSTSREKLGLEDRTRGAATRGLGSPATRRASSHTIHHVQGTLFRSLRRFKFVDVDLIHVVVPPPTFKRRQDTVRVVATLSEPAAHFFRVDP